MLNKTTVSAIRALVLLAQQGTGACWSPRKLAETMGESPTYMAKIVHHMVRAGILEAARGVKGGVSLAKKPADITLQAIVEACQGPVVGDYCRTEARTPALCSFHLASLELHDAIIGVLERWTLAGLLKKPYGQGKHDGLGCLMSRGMQVQAPVQIRIGGVL